MTTVQPPAAGVIVEVFFLRLRADGSLAYRVEQRPWSPGGTPDQAALDLAGLVPGGTAAGTVSHSTSWRFVTPDQVILTYAVLPDPEPARAATPLIEAGVVCSGDALLPAPPQLHDHHVAAHAVRHLAYLVEHDPAVGAAASAQPDLWAVVTAYGVRTPVGTHGEVHAMANGHGSARNPEMPFDGIPTWPAPHASQPA